MEAWTGRCRCGSCMCWDSAVWPASCPAPPSGSASYSGPPPRVSAEEVCRGSTLQSPLLCGGGTTRRHQCDLPHSPLGYEYHRKSGFVATAEASCDPWTGWRFGLKPQLLWKKPRMLHSCLDLTAHESSQATFRQS